jgi:hypothetical protein
VNFCPNSTQIDFEAAVYNAVRKHFHFAQITGCFFHFGDALEFVSLYNQSKRLQNLTK